MPKGETVASAAPWATPIARLSAMRLISKPTQVDTNTMADTGAAVESTMYASFSRDTLRPSVTGRMVLPTMRVLE